MATIDMTNLAQDFDMTAGKQNFGSPLGGPESAYSHYYGSAGFSDVVLLNGTLTGGGGTPSPVTGTINDIGLDLGANSSSVADVTITGIAGTDATTVIMDGGTDAQESEFFWEGLLAGDDEFIIGASNTYAVGLFGDFLNVGSGQFLNGGDDIFSGGQDGSGGYLPGLANDGGFLTYISGDADSVSGTLVGGNDLFVGAYTEVAGDTIVVSPGAILLGGHDTFLQSGVPVGFPNSYIYGDASFNHGTLIGGNDVITGDAVSQVDFMRFIGDIGANEANSIFSGGDDIITGTGGNDILIGDVWKLNGGYGTGGNDIIRGGAGNDTIYGDVEEFNGGTLTAGGNDRLYGGVGDDTIYGNSGSDSLYGDNGVDTLYGGAGNDRLFGWNDDDTIYGDGESQADQNGDDLARGGNGDDTIYGGDGNDTLHGEGDNDYLYGENGDDTLIGSGGFDYLDGGDGDDTMTGGLNADKFYFDSDANWGNDIITDFAATNNAEKIVFGGFFWNSFADLQVPGVMTQVNADVVIDDGFGNTITLLGVTLGDLDAADFQFV